MWEPCAIESYPELLLFPRTALSAEMRLVCPEIELDMPSNFYCCDTQIKHDTTVLHAEMSNAKRKKKIMTSLNARPIQETILQSTLIY